MSFEICFSTAGRTGFSEVIVAYFPDKNLPPVPGQLSYAFLGLNRSYVVTQGGKHLSFSAIEGTDGSLQNGMALV